MTAMPISSSWRFFALNHSTASGFVKSIAALGLAKPCTRASPPPDLLFIRKPRPSPSMRICESSGTYGLSETDPEPEPFELIDHAPGVGKGRFVPNEVAVMACVKAHPVGIDMDDIAGHPLLAHTARHGHDLFAVAISPAADPEAERPVGRHRRCASELLIAPDQRRHPITKDQVEAQMIRPGGNLPGCDGRLAKLVVERRRHVEKGGVALRTQ